MDSWRAYLDENRDEITAIQLMTEARVRRIAFADIQELADRISRPPHNWTPDLIWSAYEALEYDGVQHSDKHTLTDLVSLIRYAVGQDDELIPYADRVRERYVGWLAQQDQSAVEFSATERWWLDRIEACRASLRRLRRFQQSSLAHALQAATTADGSVVRSVGDLATVGTGATPLNSRRDYYEDGIIPW